MDVDFSLVAPRGSRTQTEGSEVSWYLWSLQSVRQDRNGVAGSATPAGTTGISHIFPA